MDSKTLRECAAAYTAVYNPELRQEIEEQQAFENWVNSLVEEGYDLSEYTWEEMYETYIEEQGGQRGSGSSPSQTNQSVRIPGGRTATRVMSDLGSSLSASTKVPTSSGPRNVRGGGTSKPAAKPAPTPAAKPTTPAAAKPAPTPATKPAAAAAKPAATTSAAAKPPAAKPAPTAPATPAAKPSAMDQWAKANPRLAQAQKIRQQGGSRAEVNKALYNKGTAAATSTPTVVKAGFDMFDIVKGYLLDEGYAETEEAAIAIMANMSEEWRSEIISEAEGSYGQTPKAREAMGKLAIARREKPASEYSQKGEKTKKVKEIEKHTRRLDNGPDVGNRGKKSTKPRWSGYLGAKGRGKMDQDSRDYARDRDVEYSAGENKPGPGGVTKNPKKLRKQKAMGEHD